jgi:hypothetical protein
MDPDLVKQLNNTHARGIAAMGTFADQHAALITQASAYDMRLLNGFLASQLFNLDIVQAKAAYHTPVEPAAAPLPTPPAK